MKNVFLVGERIYLRPLEKADAALLQEFINDPDVTRTLLVHRPMNLQREEEWVERVSKSERDVCLGIALKDPDRLIGAVGLHGIDGKDRKAEFGISIGDKLEWDKGYGSEALRLIVRYGFETLNLNRIALQVYENNPRAVGVYERAGFKHEGRLRQATYREGRFWDTFVMAILREEWEAQVASAAR